MIDIVGVALRLGEALESVGVPYFLGGSLASSLQGEPRATNDIDLVVDLRIEQIDGLVQALGPDFEVDEDALREAVRHRGSWNIFFLPYVLKVDLFILRLGPFDQAEFERRQAVELRPGRRIFVKSAEDSVLRKLLWFREGGGVSTTQWRDVVQILRISGPSLDQRYLKAWAKTLGLEELLAKARAEA